MLNNKFLVFIILLLVAIVSVSFVSSANLDDDSMVMTQDMKINGTLQEGGSGEVYVDPNYEGQSDGSKDSPYRDIKTALNNLDSSKSNTVYLKDGIYTGDANTKLSLIGDLILKAADGANPIIDGGNTNNFWNLSDSNILLKGITFTNFNRITDNSKGILTSSGIENLTISSCTFEKNTYARAIHLNNLNNTVIDGCTFQNNDIQTLSGGGAYVEHVNNLTFSNNIAQNHNSSYSYQGGILYSNYNTNVSVIDNRFTNVIAGRGTGIYSYYDRNLKFKNNYFNNVSGPVNSYDGRVIYIYYNSDDLDFINNTVINTKNSNYRSVYVNSNNVCNEVNITNNHFENNSQGFYLSSSTIGNVTILNNDFTNSGNFHLSSSYSGDAVVVNNNFTNGGGLTLNMQSSGNITAFGNNFINSSGGLSLSSYNEGNISAFGNNFINSSGGLSLSLSNSGNMTTFGNNFINNHRGLSLSMSNSGDMSVFDNDFINISSQSTGGGLYIYMYNSGALSVHDNDFNNVSSTGYGGAGYIDLNYNDGPTIIQNNTFNNISSSYGGGSLYISASLHNNLSLENNKFTNSLANGQNPSGGAVYISVSRPYNFENRPTVNIKNNEFINSSTVYDSTSSFPSSGGALYVSSSYGSNAVYVHFVNNTFINSSSERGGSVYASFSDSIIANNTFVNGSAENQGGILYLSGTHNTVSNNDFNNGSALKGGAIYVDSGYNNIFNNTFHDNNAGDGGAIYIYGYCNKFIDNIFSNNTASSRGGAIYSNYAYDTVINNGTFENNKAQIGGAVFFDYYQRYPDIFLGNHNNLITNCEFINNEAETAGAVVLYSSDSIIANSSFIGNNATRYGSGAVASGGIKNIIRDNLFENNTAFLYAGAIGTNDTAIINNTFIKNTAFQAGAILTINSNIVNNTFDDNNAFRGKNIAYIDNHDKTLLEGNNGLPEETIYDYDESQVINVYKEINGKFYLYDNPKTTYGTYSFQGYCIEEDASIPIVPSNIKYNGTWGILMDDLFFVRNSLDQSYVGDYLKVLILKYQNYENYNIKDLIYVFTDGDYRNSRNPIIQDVIKLAENCFTILENGNNTIEGKNYPCEFYTFINPTTRQNMIIWNCTNPILIPTLKPSKTLVESKEYNVGDNVTFTITVSNNQNFTFHNVTIRESVPNGFRLVDWINTYSDDLERISDNIWILKRDLKPGEKVQFDVILTYDYVSSKYPSNHIYVNSIESDSQSTSSSIPIQYSESTDLIITKVPLRDYSYYLEGSVVYFDIMVLNPGSTKYTGTISIRDIWNSSEYRFLNWESKYSWSRGYSNDDEIDFYYYNGLNPGESISLRLFYESKVTGIAGHRYNTVILNGNQKANASYNFYTSNMRITINKYPQAPNPTYVGVRVPYVLTIYNPGDNYIYGAWIEEDFPEEWVYDGWSGSSDFVHELTENGKHRWYYTKPLPRGPLYSITVYFNMTKAGNFTNVAIAGAIDLPNVTVSYNHTVLDNHLKAYKYVQGPAPTFVGARMSYYIVIRNEGSQSILNGVWVEEDFPEEWVYDGWSGSSDFVHVITEEGKHRWYYTKPLPYGPSYGFNVYFNMTKIGNYTNVAIAGAPGMKNSTAHHNLTVLNNSLNLYKYVQYPTYDTSGLIRYTIVIYNSYSYSGGFGNLWFEEHFPKEFVFDHWEGSNKWNLTIENGTYRWTYNGTYPSGPADVVNVFFRPTVNGTFTNTVVAGADGYANKTASVNVTVSGAAIKLEKISNNPAVELGNQVSFTIRLTNIGNGYTGGMYVREMSHPGLIYDHFTFSDIYGDDGVPKTFNSYWRYQGNGVWMYQNSFAPGQVTEFTVYFNTTEEGLTYNLINSTFNAALPLYANNTTIVYVPRMEVEKIAINPITSIDNNATFLVIVKNKGLSNLTNVVVEEKKFEGLELIGHENVNGIWDFMLFKGKYYFLLDGYIPAGGNASFIVRFKADHVGNFTNYIGVKASEIKTEMLANDSILLVNSNIEIQKITLNPEILNGENVTFTIVVKNTGLIDLTNVTVKEDFDNETLGNITFKGVNWYYDAENRLFIFNQTLSVNQISSLNVTFTARKVGYTINNVTVFAYEYGNKTASNSTLIRQANFTVEKTLNAFNVTVGDEIVYTIVVNNTGDAYLNNVTVVENYPDALEFVCVNDGWTTSDNRTFVYDGALEAEGKAILNITFRVKEGGNVTNEVSVTSKEIKVNQSANYTIFVRNPKLIVQKISLNQSVNINETVVFKIVVTNNGNVDLGNITVYENYPSGLEFIKFDGNWTTGDNKTFVHDGLLAVNDSLELNITFKAIGQGKLTNVVSVESNESSAVSQINSTFVKVYDFSVEKSLVNKTFSLGDTIVYTIIVSNTGNSNLTNVTVAEDYPDALEFVSVNGGWSTNDNRTFVYDSPLAAGAKAVLNITFKVVEGGNVTNTAFVTFNETQGNASANHTTFIKDYRYIVEKIAVDKVVSVGDDITYIIKVTNLGNCELESIKVIEKYPTDLEFKYFSGDWSSDDNKTFMSTKTLEIGKSSFLLITFKVLGKDNITNPIEVIVDENNKTVLTANDTIFSKNPVISVEKYTVNDTVYVGEKTAFDIVVANKGNVDLDNILLTEDYPAELILDSYSGKDWIRNGNIFSYNGILKPGKSIRLRVIFNTTVGGEFINEVSVRSGNLSDNSCNSTKVIYKQKPTPVNPVNPVNPVKTIKKIKKQFITSPLKFIRPHHDYHIEKHKENKLPGGHGFVLSKHPTANPFGILLLMILILSIICLIRVKSINVEINNKNFLYLALVVLLVFVSAGCAVAADVDNSTSEDLEVSAEELIVVESSDADEEVVTENAEEVVVESSDSNIESSSNVDDNDVYEAPGDSVIYVSPDAGSSGDGSYSNPYNSINSALNSLDSSNSNTIVLMDGIYKGNENTQLSNIPGNIIMMADNNANPIIDFENTANSWNLTGSHVMLTGISFENAFNSNAIIKTIGNVNNYSIINCSFKSNVDSTLLDLSSVSDVSITQCNFISNLATADNKYSIISKNSNNVSVVNNRINMHQYNVNGGVIYAEIVNNFEFSENHVENVKSANGGVVYGTGIVNFTFNKNIINQTGLNKGSGGALYLSNSKGDINILNNNITEVNSSEYGGCLYLDIQPSKLSIKQNLFDPNSSIKSKQGNGIYLITKNCNDIDISGNTFLSSHSSSNGGQIYLNSNWDKINIYDNRFIEGKSDYEGGCIYVSSQYSDVNLTNNEFSAGTCSKSNVYVSVSRGDVIAKNNRFNDNFNSERELYIASSYGNAIMENNSFINNYMHWGSAYIGHSYNGYLSALNNKFIFNGKSSEYGGSLYVTSYYADGVNVSCNEFTNSIGSDGGALYVTVSYSKTCDIENNTFINSTGRDGGALYVRPYYTSIDIVNNKFENSVSSRYGGAIYVDYSVENNDQVNIKNNTIVNSKSSLDGGALYFTGYISRQNLNVGANVSDNKIINSTSGASGGAVYWYIHDRYTKGSAFKNNFINNSFVNSTARQNGGIIYISTPDEEYGLIADNEFINGAAKNGGAISVIGSNLNISNNLFRNNDAIVYGGSIFSQDTSNDVLNNNTFVDGSAQMGGAIFIDYPQNYGLSNANKYENKNITISNSEFNNNHAQTGGAVIVYSDDTLIFNSTFTDNQATRYGSGALVSGGKNSQILNNTFENNVAFLYGGAIGTNNSAIINNTFKKNSAYQAGAILTINSTIVNNKFIDNDAERGPSIVYLDTYEYKTKDYETLLVNNVLPEGSVYAYNSSNALNIDLDLFGKYFFVKVDGGYEYEGYCIEDKDSIPLRNNGSSGILIDDLSFIRNSIDQSYVGDYLKVLFISKLNVEFNIHEYITIFTDTEYWNSDDPDIRNIITLTESMTFNDDNTVIFNNNTYKFQAFVNPTTRQNLILINSTLVEEIPEISVSKKPDKLSVEDGDVIQYTINVTNMKNMTVHNLVVRESLPFGLTYVSFDNPNNIWQRQDSTSWKLNRNLKPYESVQLIIYARVTYAGSSTLTNNVYASIAELTESKRAASTVNVRQAHFQMQKNVYSQKTYYPGEIVKFVISVTNDGKGASGSLNLRDSFPSQLEYVGLSSSDNRWTFSHIQNGNDLYVNYNGYFKVGQVSILNLMFKVKEDNRYYSNLYNYAYLIFDQHEQASSSAYFSIGGDEQPEFYVYKTGPLNVMLGDEFTYTLGASNIKGHLKDFYIDEIFPSEWEYVRSNCENYMIHSIIEPNHHRWTFKPTQNNYEIRYTNIQIVFKSKGIGTFTNTVTGVANGELTKTATAQTSVHGSILSIEEFVQNPVVNMGEQAVFTLRINNSGDVGESNFYINELPASGLVYDHIVDSTNKFMYDSQTSRVRYNGTLNPNESVKFDIVYNVTKQGVNTNIAQLVHKNLNKFASSSTYAQNYDMSVEKWYLNFYNTYGQNTTFVIRVKNTGNLNLTDVFVEESKFDGLNYLNYTNVKGLWRVIENNGKYLFKLNGTLAPGETAEFDVLFNTTSYGKLTNIVIAGSNQTEIITANASVVSGNPSIEIEKIALNKTVKVGENVTFTVNVKNTGTMPLYGISVEENFPDNLEYVSSTGNWVYDSKNRLFILETALSACEPDNVESFNVTFRALKPGNVTNIVNIVSKIVNGTANDTIFIESYDFKVEKLCLNSSVKVNDTVVYSIIVTNIGNMNLTNVTVVEQYPDDLQFVSIGPNWKTTDNKTFTFIGFIAPGDNAVLNITFKAVEKGNLTNVATVTTNETEGNKSANDTVFVRYIEYRVSKVAVDKVVYVGGEAKFIIEVTNLGNIDLKGIKVYEKYPSSLKYIFHEGDWNTSDFREFVLTSSLAPGNSTTLNITFKVLLKGNITNPIDVLFENESRSANDTVYALKVGINVDKISLNRTVYLGNQSGFDIVVTNTGNIDLTNVTLFESYPKELIFDSFVGDNWTQSGNVFKYSGVLKAGESIKLFVLFNTTKFGVYVNDVAVKADINNLTELINEVIENMAGNSSEITRLIEEIIDKISNNITDNSSNITKVNVLYPEPDDPEPINPDIPKNSSDIVKIVYKKVYISNSKDSNNSSNSSEAKLESEIPLENTATGNPLALLALMLLMIILPLRKKK